MIPKYSIILFKNIFRWISPFAKWIPIGFAGMFLLIDFLIDAFKEGLIFAIREFSFKLFLAERTIQEKVSLSITDPSAYGLFSFIEILIALWILLQFYRLLRVIFKQFQTDINNFTIILVWLVLVFLIEMVSSTVYYFTVDNTSFFIPIKDGLIYLIINISSVFQSLVIF